MAERKQLVSVTLSEISTQDNATDHEIELEGGYGGFEVKFTTTFDQIRTFFTQKREKGKKAEIRAVN